MQCNLSIAINYICKYYCKHLLSFDRQLKFYIGSLQFVFDVFRLALVVLKGMVSQCICLNRLILRCHFKIGCYQNPTSYLYYSSSPANIFITSLLRWYIDENKVAVHIPIIIMLIITTSDPISSNFQKLWKICQCPKDLQINSSQSA